jgi:hypothetical protein
MQITYGVPIVAPSITGHPAALPPEQDRAPSDTRVSKVDTGNSTEGTSARAQGDEQTAPPSAMQRKIMEILEQQAKDLDTE